MSTDLSDSLMESCSSEESTDGDWSLSESDESDDAGPDMMDSLPLIDSALLRPSLTMFMAHQIQTYFKFDPTCASISPTGSQDQSGQLFEMPSLATFIQQIADFIWDHSFNSHGKYPNASVSGSRSRGSEYRTRMVVGHLVQAMYYLHQLRSKQPEAVASTHDACHRLFLAAMLVARKYAHDTRIPFENWSRALWKSPCGGTVSPVLHRRERCYTVKELQQMEMEFLGLLDWRVQVDMQAYTIWLRDVERQFIRWMQTRLLSVDLQESRDLAEMESRYYLTQLWEPVRSSLDHPQKSNTISFMDDAGTVPPISQPIRHPTFHELNQFRLLHLFMHTASEDISLDYFGPLQPSAHPSQLRMLPLPSPSSTQSFYSPITRNNSIEQYHYAPNENVPSTWNPAGDYRPTKRSRTDEFLPGILPTTIESSRSSSSYSIQCPTLVSMGSLLTQQGDDRSREVSVSAVPMNMLSIDHMIYHDE